MDQYKIGDKRKFETIIPEMSFKRLVSHLIKEIQYEKSDNQKKDEKEKIDDKKMIRITKGVHELLQQDIENYVQKWISLATILRSYKKPKFMSASDLDFFQKFTMHGLKLT